MPSSNWRPSMLLSSFAWNRKKPHRFSALIDFDEIDMIYGVGQSAFAGWFIIIVGFLPKTSNVKLLDFTYQEFCENSRSKY